MGTQQDETTKKNIEMNILKVNPETKYDKAMLKQQKMEGWTLSLALLLAVGLTFFIWQFSDVWWSLIILAALGGIIGGLLHSVKWFYRTIGNGEWQWDKLWWRFLNPLVSGVMGFSIFIVFRSGIQKDIPTNNGKEAFVAYSIGFLTGLFADNAMSKLRDIAYVFFGPTQPPASKPKNTKDNKKNAED